MSGTGTDVDRLTGEVAQVVAAIDRAKADTHGAAENAKATTMRAAASGYGAIAQQLRAVQQQLEQVAGVLDGAATEAKRAGATVREVTDRMSPDQVAARLTSAAEQITGMRGTLYGAVQQLANVTNHVSAALRGGQPGSLLQRIDAIRQIITIAAQRGDAAKAVIEGEAAQSRQLGRQGNCAARRSAHQASRASKHQRHQEDQANHLGRQRGRQQLWERRTTTEMPDQRTTGPGPPTRVLCRLDQPDRWAASPRGSPPPSEPARTRTTSGTTAWSATSPMSWLTGGTGCIRCRTPTWSPPHGPPPGTPARPPSDRTT